MKYRYRRLRSLIFVFAVLSSLSVNAEAKGLKNLLWAFATQQADISVYNLTYSNIKGIKWTDHGMQPGSMSKKGYLRIVVLGKTDLELRGKNNRVDSVFLISSTPSKRFKFILDRELGKGVVSELRNCRSSFISTQKSFQIKFKDKPVIYANADAVLSFEPYMSPLQTSFQFYLVRPADWAC